MRPKPDLDKIMADIAAEGIAEAELARAPADRAAPAIPVWLDRLEPWLAVSLGGALGAPSRYFAGTFVTNHWGSGFPWATLVINLTGCLALGFFLTAITERVAVRASLRLLIATGFLGAYTTFSTFSYETVHLIQTGHLARALVYAGVSLIGGLIAVLLGVEAAARI
jgi:fluoride exporter